MATAPPVAPQHSISERILALEIVRQVLLLRYSLFVRNAMIEALNATEFAVASLIRDMLQTASGLRDPAAVRQLQQLVDQINALRAPVWAVARDKAIFDLLVSGDQEPLQQELLYNHFVPELQLDQPMPGGAIALATPFQGRLLREWLDDAQADEAKRIRNVMFVAVGGGLAAAAVARKVVGSAKARGRDGVTQTSRNHIDSIIRSAAVHVASQSREQFYQANPEVFHLEQFYAILDGHTTPLCRGLNLKRFPVGEGPIPPLHIRCRSLRLAVLSEELGGPLHEPEVYDAWIRRQPRAVQIELLGATRAARVRARQVDPGAFVDYGSKPMSLLQVQAAAKRLMGAY